jgi:HSP20 family molecular chaperone IbpA
MHDTHSRHKRIRELVEESSLWDMDFMMRNLQQEFDRLERGMNHLVFGLDDKPVTRIPRPIPLTPRFDAEESSSEFKLRVYLPGVAEDSVSVRIDKFGVEISACSEESYCRPFYLDTLSRDPLDPDSAQATFKDAILEIQVAKVKKRTVPIG